MKGSICPVTYGRAKGGLRLQRRVGRLGKSLLSGQTECEAIQIKESVLGSLAEVSRRIVTPTFLASVFILSTTTAIRPMPHMRQHMIWHSTPRSPASSLKCLPPVLLKRTWNEYLTALIQALTGIAATETLSL